MTPERWVRVQEVFAAALEKEPPARQAFVTASSGRDDELREEVESLLAEHDKAASEFLESPAVGALAAAVATRSTLSRGTRLGFFEIVAALGAGGMGEVYRAKDTRLGREVAIKVLPVEVSADPERVKRFEKEARSASALNHPNIVTIHDTGTSDGVAWIAMELVEGQTLRQLLSAGAMPVKRLLAIATQIAEGLAKAHEVGIVHRDLKPENVMVTRAGLVKILDFGLAKLTGPVSGSGEHSQPPTRSGTSPGLILGTVGYMSPEQAAGKPVDYRADQFSFGSILYEMATGRRAFQKKTAVDTLSAILNEEPEAMSEVNPQAPAPLRWIVERCLAKEPEDRYVSTRDLARELSSVQSHLSEAGSRTPVPGRSRGVRGLRGLAAVALILALVAAGAIGRQLWLSRRSTPSVPSFHQLTFRRGNLLTARFSPDGRTVVYGAAYDGAPSEIFTVRTDSPVSTPIGLRRADVMSVSSKSELAVLMNKKDASGPGGGGTLARVPLGGGTPRELLEDVMQADWAPNGEDLAIVRYLASGRYRVEYPIGTALFEGVLGDPRIRVSPGGALVAVADGDAIATIDRNGKRRVVTSGWLNLYHLAWSPRGDELIVSGGRTPDEHSIYAVSLSGRLRVLMSNAVGLVLHDMAPDGRLLLEDFREQCGIACLARGEKRERELGWMGTSFVRSISSDGGFVVFSQSPPAPDPNGIYLRKTDGAPPVRLGEGVIQDLSSDGRWVLTRLPGPPARLVLLPTGPGIKRAIPVEGLEPVYARLLPNGKGLAIRADAKDGNPVLAVVGLEGGPPRLIVKEGLAGDSHFAVAPDGDRIASVSKDQRLRITTVSSSRTTTVPGDPLEPVDDLLGWSADARFLYVWRYGMVPGRIDRIDLADGRRQDWKRLIPEDSTAIAAVGPFAIAPDGHSYAYSYIRTLVDDLYVVEGVR